jgi:hypothetical protein
MKQVQKRGVYLSLVLGVFQFNVKDHPYQLELIYCLVMGIIGLMIENELNINVQKP